MKAKPLTISLVFLFAVVILILTEHFADEGNIDIFFALWMVVAVYSASKLLTDLKKLDNYLKNGNKKSNK